MLFRDLRAHPGKLGMASISGRMDVLRRQKSVEPRNELLLARGVAYILPYLRLEPYKQV